MFLPLWTTLLLAAQPGVRVSAMSWFEPSHPEAVVQVENSTDQPVVITRIIGYPGGEFDETVRPPLTVGPGATASITLRRREGHDAPIGALYLRFGTTPFQVLVYEVETLPTEPPPWRTLQLGTGKETKVGGLISQTDGTLLAAPSTLPPSRGVSLEGHRAILLGALDKTLVDAVLQDARPALDACYESALAENPNVVGEIVEKFIISKEGTVSSTTTKTSTVRFPHLEECVSKVFSGLRFPEPKGGGIVIVSYPIKFLP